ncbi:MAG TPA: hypothetical protein V6D20_15825, partial [Candidatus Obscuribacterales bacterium]
RGYILLSYAAEPSKAVEDFKYAARKVASRAEAYLGLAKAYESLGDYENSINSYSKIINNPKTYDRVMVLTAYAGRCLSEFSYALLLANEEMHKEAVEQFNCCVKDYQLSNIRNQNFYAEIFKNRCLSYMSLGRRWKARLDARLKGLKTKDIEGLKLTNLEKISAAILILCLLPAGFFCAREIPNLGIFSSFERWSNQQLLKE